MAQKLRGDSEYTAVQEQEDRNKIHGSSEKGGCADRSTLARHRWKTVFNVHQSSRSRFVFSQIIVLCLLYAGGVFTFLHEMSLSPCTIDTVYVSRTSLKATSRIGQAGFWGYVGFKNAFSQILKIAGIVFTLHS